MFKSLIHFNYILWLYVNIILVHMDISFPRTIAEESVNFSMCVLVTFVKKSADRWWGSFVDSVLCSTGWLIYFL